MTNFKNGINLFARTVHERAVKAGWWEGPNGTNIPAKLLLIHSEISEAVEGFRKDAMDDKLPDRKQVEVELADCVIRIADLAGGLGLDLGGAIDEKMEFNLTRADHKREERAKVGGKRF